MYRLICILSFIVMFSFSSLHAEVTTQNNQVLSTTSMNISIPSSFSKLSADEEKFVISHILNDLVSFDIQRLHSDDLESVFNGTFYVLKQKAKTMWQCGSDITAWRNQDHLFPIPDTSTEYAVMPDMLKMIKLTFKLKTNDDAVKLQNALDMLYPNRSFGSDDTRMTKKFLHQNNQWIFIRGKFFEKLSGFIFSTDADGTIKSVAYSMSISQS